MGTLSRGHPKRNLLHQPSPLFSTFSTSAAFGQASAYDCTESMQSMVDSKAECKMEDPPKCTEVPATPGEALDACIKCVMDGMGFVDDVGAIVTIDTQILLDSHSVECLKAVGLQDDEEKEEGEKKEDDEEKEEGEKKPKKELTDLLNDLMGQDFNTVMDSDLKYNLYRLFGAAGACIEGDDSLGIPGATPTDEYTCQPSAEETTEGTA